MSAKQLPSIGRMVSYVVPRDKVPDGHPRIAAAVITAVHHFGDDKTPARVNLTVFPDLAPPFAVANCSQADTSKPLEDCWHWPVQVGPTVSSSILRVT